MFRIAVYMLCALADLSGSATPAQTAGQYVTYTDLYVGVLADRPGMLYVGCTPDRSYYMPVCFVPELAGYKPGVYRCFLKDGQPWRERVALAPALPVPVPVPAVQFAPPAPCLNGRCPKVR